MREISLNKIVYFEAVARHSGISSAAEELCVSASAVSQHIKQLEEQLGVQVFRRANRKLILTEDGKRLYTSANQALDILRKARQQIARKKESYKLILRASTSFGVMWLGPRLKKFIDANPLWDLHIDATSELTDFEKENVDLDIRYDSANMQGLYNEKIIDDIVLPMCSPEYLESLAFQQNSVENILQNARLIYTVKSRASWQSWLKINNIKNIKTNHGLSLDRSTMSIQCAVDGLGIVLETATMAMNQLRTQELVPVFPELKMLRFPAYWVICPTNHINRNVCRIFMQWLREEASEHEQRKLFLLQSLGCHNIIEFDIDK